MKKLIVLIPILLLIACSFACQTNPKLLKYNDDVDEEISMAMKVPVYFWDRFLDLFDILQLNLSFGDGFLVNYHYTKWVQGGAGYRDAVCVGLMPRSLGMWHEDRVEGGVAFPLFFGNMYYKNIKREALFGTPTLFDHDVCYKGVDHLGDYRHWWNIGMSAHAAIVGFDIEFSPYEFWDFFLGWFGLPFIVPIDRIGFGTELDIANDDLRARLVRNKSDLPYYNYTLDPHPKGPACSGDKGSE